MYLICLPRELGGGGAEGANGRAIISGARRIVENPGRGVPHVKEIQTPLIQNRFPIAGRGRSTNKVFHFLPPGNENPYDTISAVLHAVLAFGVSASR